MNRELCYANEVRFGEYELETLLGRASAAEVWTARRRGSRAHVVVKRLLEHLSQNEKIAALFARESRLAMRLEHPSIVRVLDAGVVDDVPFIVTEKVDGPDLRAFLHTYLRANEEAPPLAITAHVIVDVASALAYAHGQGVVHRDVSPSNVLLSKAGNAKLADFGIAKATFETASRSMSTIRGKPGYVAPEVIEGARPDERADVFALGVVLHEMLTGRRLFHGSTQFQTLSATLDGPISAPSRANAGVPEIVDDVCMRALARDPSRRTVDAAEIARALGALRANGRELLRRAIASQ